MSVIRFDEQPLLLVGLRDRDLVRVDPVRLDVAGPRAVEEIVGSDPGDAVALLAGPGRVALARVDDGTGEVERERRGLAAARFRPMRSVTAGLTVAVVAFENSVATDVAPFSV